MTPDQERWAEAHTVLEQHGDGVFDFIADRLVTLSTEGDEQGVRRWQAILDRIPALMRGSIQ